MNTFKKIILSISIILAVALGNNILAQPQPVDGHGSDNDESPAGGGAPIGGGILILIGLAGVYGAKKYYDSSNDFKKE